MNGCSQCPNDFNLCNDCVESELKEIERLQKENAQLKEALRIAHAVVCEKCSNKDIPKSCHRCWVTDDKNGRKESEGEG